MDKLCLTHDFIRIADTEPAFSLGLLALPDANENRAFFSKLGLYCTKFDMTMDSLTKVYAVVAFALRFNNNAFRRSTIEDDCFYAEIYDSFEGTILYVVLQEEASNKTLLNLYITLEYPSEREVIC